MLSVILFIVLVSQKMKIGNTISVSKSKKLNIGLIALGVIALLNSIFNVWLHRGWWNTDFFSPFFTGFKR